MLYYEKVGNDIKAKHYYNKNNNEIGNKITKNQMVYLNNLKYIRYGVKADIKQLEKLTKKQAGYYIGKLKGEIDQILSNMVKQKYTGKELVKAIKLQSRMLAGSIR